MLGLNPRSNVAGTLRVPFGGTRSVPTALRAIISPLRAESNLVHPTKAYLTEDRSAKPHNTRRYGFLFSVRVFPFAQITFRPGACRTSSLLAGIREEEPVLACSATLHRVRYSLVG